MFSKTVQATKGFRPGLKPATTSASGSRECVCAQNVAAADKMEANTLTEFLNIFTLDEIFAKSLKCCLLVEDLFSASANQTVAHEKRAVTSI